MFTITEGAPAVLETNLPDARGKRGFVRGRIPPSITELHERCNFACTTAGVHALVINLFGRMPQRKAALAFRPTVHITSPSGTSALGAFNVLHMLSRIRYCYIVNYYVLPHCIIHVR